MKRKLALRRKQRLTWSARIADCSNPSQSASIGACTACKMWMSGCGDVQPPGDASRGRNYNYSDCGHRHWLIDCRWCGMESHAGQVRTEVGGAGLQR